MGASAREVEIVQRVAVWRDRGRVGDATCVLPNRGFGRIDMFLTPSIEGTRATRRDWLATGRTGAPAMVQSPGMPTKGSD